MQGNRRWSKGKIISGIIILLLFGGAWQSIGIRNESKIYTAPGQYIDVETFKAHCYSKGDGEVAFAFITGSGTPCAYTDFYMLQNRLADRGQTITFDHTGSGWSTETDSIRSIENLVRELNEIIETLAFDKRVVLICHSLGSLEAIRYAQEYPERVAGIIFLDSGSPEFYSTDSEILAKMVNGMAALTRKVGMNRLLGALGSFLPMYGEDIRNNQLTDELKAIDRAMYYQFAGNSSSLRTIDLMNENATTILEGDRLEHIPILVLSSDSGKAWNAVQKQLALWSKQSEQMTLKGGAHYLYWSNYEEVVAAIEEFLERYVE